jgi:nuclear pore complex protein Nup107
VPSPQTSTQLKASCHTWEDKLWAQVSIVCEEKESEELGKLNHSFWEGDGPESANPKSRVPDEAEEIEADEWEKEVIESLESLADVVVEG